MYLEAYRARLDLEEVLNDQSRMRGLWAPEFYRDEAKILRKELKKLHDAVERLLWYMPNVVP